MMAVPSKTIARLENGEARVCMDGRTLSISQISRSGRENFCPIELVSAALGS